MSCSRRGHRRLLHLWVGAFLLASSILVMETGCATLRKPTSEADFSPTQTTLLEHMELSPALAAAKESFALCALNDADRAPPDTAAEKPKSNTAPQVWKRDRRRPSFARVYVGDGNSLELVSLHVSVTIEGPRARTLVDHVFRNPHDKQLEGTFEYPLPSGASPSYFAMFLGQSRDTVPQRFGRPGMAAPLPVDDLARLTPKQLVKHIDSTDWGKLQEARIVGQDRALEAYEEVVRGKVDPALLEYAGGNTFRGRVFPIAPKGYNRVILAYEETLPASRQQTHYRFSLPDCRVTELRVDVRFDESSGKAIVMRDPKPAHREVASPFSETWKGKGPGGDLVIAFQPDNLLVQAIAGKHAESGPSYLYARVRPDLKVERTEPFASHAVFLLDTSMSEHPDRFAVSMKLLKKILESDPDIKHFNVLAFDVAARWVSPKGWLPNTPSGRETVFSRLNGTLLEGATDLSAALDKLCQPGFDVQPGTPLNVFLLSDGQLTWGDTDAGQLAARFEARCPYPTRFHCYRVGLGAENMELFEALTRRGGVFNCFDSTDLTAAATAHRYQCLQVESVRFTGADISDLLVAGRKAAVYPGGELIVAGRLPDGKHCSNLELVVTGTFLGKKVTLEYPVAPASSELAARGWAEVAVASLLAINDPKLDSLVTAICQQFGIASRAASFLVLENDSDYKRLDLEKERGQTAPGDLGSFLDGLWSSLGKPASAKELFERFLARIGPSGKIPEGGGPEVQKLMRLLAEEDFELPGSNLEGTLVPEKSLPRAYLQARRSNPRDVAVYVQEASRRAAAGDAFGAVRALSCVVEQHPGRADALRLVGYRLLDLHQPVQAARLFARVQHNRPFEAHSYRDLARSLEEAGRYGLASVNYELILAGTWHGRFGTALKTVAEEEYVQMMQQALRCHQLGKGLAQQFGQRVEGLARGREPSDLRVTISWNTDATDVDLWVFEPDGTKVFYSSPSSPNGGQLSQDQTQGYGPERYRIAKARKGTYRVVVHNFAPNPNLLGGETHVQVVITRYAGTPRETVERHQVVLDKPKQEVEVARVRY